MKPVVDGVTATVTPTTVAFVWLYERAIVKLDLNLCQRSRIVHLDSNEFQLDFKVGKKFD
jgi:hypothetical protein